MSRSSLCLVSPISLFSLFLRHHLIFNVFLPKCRLYSLYFLTLFVSLCLPLYLGWCTSRLIRVTVVHRKPMEESNKKTETNVFRCSYTYHHYTPNIIMAFRWWQQLSWRARTMMSWLQNFCWTSNYACFVFWVNLSIFVPFNYFDGIANY